MMHHSVILSLFYLPGSNDEKDFLTAAWKLAEIPYVENFKIYKQVSPKNTFDFGIAMDFSNAGYYQQYSDHPYHQQFLEKHWAKGVREFLEIDYEPLPSI